jgi:hypothetical protein
MAQVTCTVQKGIAPEVEIEAGQATISVATAHERNHTSSELCSYCQRVIDNWFTLIQDNDHRFPHHGDIHRLKQATMKCSLCYQFWRNLQSGSRTLSTERNWPLGISIEPRSFSEANRESGPWCLRLSVLRGADEDHANDETADSNTPSPDREVRHMTVDVLPATLAGECFTEFQALTITHIGGFVQYTGWHSSCATVARGVP